MVSIVVLMLLSVFTALLLYECRNIGVSMVRERLRKKSVVALLVFLLFSVVNESICMAEEKYTYTLTEISKNVVSRSTAVLTNCICELTAGGTDKASSSFSVTQSETQGTTATLTFNVDEYKKLTATGQTDAVVALSRTDAFQKCLGNDSIEDLVNDIKAYSKDESTILILTGSSIQPNYGAAYRMFRPFSGPLGTVTAVLIIAILAVIVLCTIIDVCYMTVEFFRSSVDEKESSDGKKHWVSADARKAYKKVMGDDNSSGSTGKVLLTYGVSRMWMWIVLVLLILYLADGEIFKIIPKLMKLMNGFK